MAETADPTKQFRAKRVQPLDEMIKNRRILFYRRIIVSDGLAKVCIKTIHVYSCPSTSLVNRGSILPPDCLCLKWRNNGLQFIVVIATLFSALAAEFMQLPSQTFKELFTFLLNAHMLPVTAKIPSINVILTFQVKLQNIVSFSSISNSSRNVKSRLRQDILTQSKSRQALTKDPDP